MHAALRVLRLRLLCSYSSFLLAMLLGGLSASMMIFFTRAPLFEALSYADASPLSLGDLIVLALSGCEPYDPTSLKVFVLPLGWILLLSGPLFAVLVCGSGRDAAYEHMLMLKSSSRLACWFSRLLCDLLVFIAYWAIALIACCLFAIRWDAVFSFSVQAAAVMPAGIFPEAGGVFMASCLPFLAGAAIGGAASILIGETLSLYAGRVLSFVASVSLVIFTAYFQVPVLPLNLCMFVRNEDVVTGGLPFAPALAAACGIIVLSISLGAARSARADLLGRGSSL